MKPFVYLLGVFIETRIIKMDISYDKSVTKRCFKSDQTVLNNLNIVCNASNKTMLLLWNTYQIFVYENPEFQTAAVILFPQFQIQDLIIAGNYLVSLDCSGNVHTTSLKLKAATQKGLIYDFRPRELNIVGSVLYNENHVLCLKYESNSYFLTLHKINTDFFLLKKVQVTYKEHLPIIRTKHIMKVQSVSEKHLQSLKKVFDAEDLSNRNKYKLVIVSFDKLNIYGCLFSINMTEDHIILIKLYSCPSEICNLHVIEAEQCNILLIGLTMGTVIHLPLNNVQSPQIIHLNIAIHQFLAFEDTILYTDGNSMWKVENIMSKDLKFSQFFVRNVKDFTKLDDQIICTTFTNLIYTFSLVDEASYLKHESNDEYCSAEELFNNSDYLKKIMEEVKKNDELIKTLTNEKNYITALSLSNRQDVMDNIISHKVIVYENYEDAIAENSKVILTNNFTEYFDDKSFFFLIKIVTETEHNFHDILSNTLGDLRIHMTLTTESKVLRTTSIKITERLRKLTFLLPLKNDMVDTNEMHVKIKIMSNVPGAYDKKQKIWTILYRKNVILHSEHFIQFKLSSNKLKCLKNVEDPLEIQIMQTAVNQYGNLFHFDDILKQKPKSNEWQMYVRLPHLYQEVFRNKDLHSKHLTSKKVYYFLQQFTSEDFLKSKSNLLFLIGKEKVKVEIYNDGFSTPLLRVTCVNVKIALNIRNFLSDLIYFVFTNFSPGKEFVNLSCYSTIENLQKSVRKCITIGSSQEEIVPLIEQFERNVIGILPI